MTPMELIPFFADLKDIEGKKPSEINYLFRDEYIVLMRAAGYTMQAIADKTGVSKVTVLNTVKDYTEEIKRMQLAGLEELIHAHRLTLRQRVESYAKDISKIDAELETRDLKKISTEKLFDLKIKLNKAFVDDIIEKIYMAPRKKNYCLEKIGAEL